MKTLKIIFILLPLSICDLTAVVIAVPFGYVYGLLAGGFRKGLNIADDRCMEAWKLTNTNQD